MSKIKKNRLEKLEKQLRSTTLRIAWLGRGEDGDAKIAELIASGHAKTGDEFMLVSRARKEFGGAHKGKRNGGQRNPLRFGKSTNHPSIEPTDF